MLFNLEGSQKNKLKLPCLSTKVSLNARARLPPDVVSSDLRGRSRRGFARKGPPPPKAWLFAFFLLIGVACSRPGVDEQRPGLPPLGRFEARSRRPNKWGGAVVWAVLADDDDDGMTRTRVVWAATSWMADDDERGQRCANHLCHAPDLLFPSLPRRIKGRHSLPPPWCPQAASCQARKDCPLDPPPGSLGKIMRLARKRGCQAPPPFFSSFP